MNIMLGMLQYQALALRTVKPHDSKELAIADWSLGLGGELSEVVSLIAEEVEEDKMEVAKELGDVLWYATALAKELNISLPENLLDLIMQDNPMDDLGGTLIGLVINIGTIQERMKHRLMHKESTDTTTVSGQLMGVFEKLADLCKWYHISVKDVAELNAGKLAHRYNTKNGGVYSKEASLQRHQAEVAFEDTATYKRLRHNITGEKIEILPTDVEVL